MNDSIVSINSTPEQPLGIASFVKRMHEHACQWSVAIEATLECHRMAAHVYPEPLQPLPQWAVDKLSAAFADDSLRDYRLHRRYLETAMDAAQGNECPQRFEIWNPGKSSAHHFSRLEIRSASLMEARERLSALKIEFPQAFVAQVDARDTGSGTTDPALLDTLLGRLWHAGTSFLQEGDQCFEIQDETGRTVNIEASVLLAHPCFARLSERAQAAVRAGLARESVISGEVV